MSRPARGAWIETPCMKASGVGHGRAPHGARGLKLPLLGLSVLSATVAPRTGRVD